MRASQLVDDLAAQGRHHFTTDEAIEALGGSRAAANAQLRRLRRRGKIASPARSFHVIVPPEYRRQGCPPAEHFVDPLMETLGEPYYVGLLSAAEKYGAAHQRPQIFQVVTRRNRPTLECGRVRITSIARGDLERMPVTTAKTPRGYVRYATPEVTALELVGYPRHAGGLDNAATVIRELVEQMDEERLVVVAELSPIGWSQRLGYLLELVEQDRMAEVLEPLVADRARSYAPLRRAAGTKGAERSSKWKLVINTSVDPDE